MLSVLTPSVNMLSVVILRVVVPWKAARRSILSKLRDSSEGFKLIFLGTDRYYG
jgi:hypothetical protein